MENPRAAFERFPVLAALPGLRHSFTTRVPGIEIQGDKSDALRQLDRVHRGIRLEQGLDSGIFVTAEQVHSAEVRVVGESITADHCFPACDGLVTDRPDVCLGIYVADCCAVFLVDPIHRAIGLVHSGKKGTEQDIVRRAIDLMASRFNSEAADLVVQLSPCIRPPHYEVDFAAEVVRSCRARGVVHVHDGGVCTACNLEHYYSYRAEKAKTGRMLALLALTFGEGS